MLAAIYDFPVPCQSLFREDFPMTRRMLSLVAVLVAVGITLFAGALQAHGATSTGAQFGSQFIDLGGFSGSFTGGDSAIGGSHVGMGISSPVHLINSVNVLFATNPNDTSEGYGSIIVSGLEDAPLNENTVFGISILTLGPVSVYQETSLGFGYGSNHGSAFVIISDFDLDYAILRNYRFPIQPEPGEPVTYGVNFIVDFYGSFGPGEAGDALGRPFVAVPTPGALGCFSLAMLAACRRRRPTA